jgi:hypothetical protein
MGLYKKPKKVKSVKTRFDNIISGYYSNVQVKPSGVRINQWEKWPDGVMTFVLKQRFPVGKTDIDVAKLVRTMYRYYNVQHQRKVDTKVGQKFTDNNSKYICFRLYEANYSGIYKCEFQILPIVNQTYYLIYDKEVTRKIMKFIEEMRTAINENDLVNYIKGFNEVVQAKQTYEFE